VGEKKIETIAFLSLFVDKDKSYTHVVVTVVVALVVTDVVVAIVPYVVVAIVVTDVVIAIVPYVVVAIVVTDVVFGINPNVVVFACVDIDTVDVDVLGIICRCFLGPYCNRCNVF